MTKQKTLVFQDLHNKVTQVDEIVRIEQPTRVIILGDCFDSTDDTPEQAAHTALWVRARLDRYEFLWGNHEVSYFSDNPSHTCGGYTVDKHRIINHILKPEHTRLFRFHTWVNNYLATHAGLSMNYMHPMFSPSSEQFKTWLIRQEEEANIAMAIGGHHWFLNTGEIRGGEYPCGGLTWCDFRTEFEPIPGLNQIFGHTSSPLPSIIRFQGGQNICLDTDKLYYARFTTEGSEPILISSDILKTYELNHQSA